jgi:cystathionine beta-lyase
VATRLSADPDPPADLFAVDLDLVRQRRSAKWRMFPSDVLPMSVAETDFALAPCVADALRAALERSDTGYAMWDGLPEIFAAWAKRRSGWAPDPAAVAVLPDVIAAIEEVLKLLTAPGDGVVIMPPVYPPFWRAIDDTGRRVVEVPLLDASSTGTVGTVQPRIDLDGIETALRGGARAVLLCSPHNPLGLVWSRGELAALAERCAAYDALVISDEIHAPLTLGDARHVPYGCLGDVHAVVVTSVSKAFNLAGLKCAFAVGCSPATSAALQQIPIQARNTTGQLGVLATEAALRDGDDWLDALLQQLASNIDALDHELTADVPQVRWRRPEAGYLAWLDFRALELGDDPAQRLLDRGRIALLPGPSFGAGGEGFARLNIGTSPELISEGVRRIVRALR